MSRWTLNDGVTTYTFEISPNQMDGPVPTRRMEVMPGGTDGFLRAFSRKDEARPFTFGGVVRSQVQHDHLLEWAAKPGKLTLTDHLGRQYEVVMERLEFAEQRPTKRNPWRFHYTMHALVLRRLP